MRKAARQIVALGARAVVVKGGHLSGPATDLLYDGSEFTEFTSERFNTINTHGTGCTFASAAAAGLAQGKSIQEAVAQAKHTSPKPSATPTPWVKGTAPSTTFTSSGRIDENTRLSSRLLNWRALTAKSFKLAPTLHSGPVDGILLPDTTAIVDTCSICSV